MSQCGTPSHIVNSTVHPNNGVDRRGEWERCNFNPVPINNNQFVIMGSTQLPDGRILPIRFLVDTGAQINAMRPGIFPPQFVYPLAQPQSVRGANGEKIAGGTHGVQFQLTLTGMTTKDKKPVTANIPTSMPIMELGGGGFDGILSNQWLGENRTLVDPFQREVIFRVNEKSHVVQGPCDQEWLVSANPAQLASQSFFVAYLGPPPPPPPPDVTSPLRIMSNNDNEGMNDEVTPPGPTPELFCNLGQVLARDDNPSIFAITLLEHNSGEAPSHECESTPAHGSVIQLGFPNTPGDIFTMEPSEGVSSPPFSLFPSLTTSPAYICTNKKNIDNSPVLYENQGTRPIFT